jgi:hypothetical protein
MSRIEGLELERIPHRIVPMTEISSVDQQREDSKTVTPQAMPLWQIPTTMTSYENDENQLTVEMGHLIGKNTHSRQPNDPLFSKLEAMETRPLKEKDFVKVRDDFAAYLELVTPLQSMQETQSAIIQSEMKVAIKQHQVLQKSFAEKCREIAASSGGVLNFLSDVATHFSFFFGLASRSVAPGLAAGSVAVYLGWYINKVYGSKFSNDLAKRWATVYDQHGRQPVVVDEMQKKYAYYLDLGMAAVMFGVMGATMSVTGNTPSVLYAGLKSKAMEGVRGALAFLSFIANSGKLVCEFRDIKSDIAMTNHRNTGSRLDHALNLYLSTMGHTHDNRMTIQTNASTAMKTRRRAESQLVRAMKPSI